MPSQGHTCSACGREHDIDFEIESRGSPGSNWGPMAGSYPAEGSEVSFTFPDKCENPECEYHDGWPAGTEEEFELRCRESVEQGDWDPDPHDY